MRTAIICGALMVTAPLAGCVTTMVDPASKAMTAAQEAEQQRVHRQECRRLNLLLGDRSLTPAQIAEARLKRDTMLCEGA
jgi:hypothetical protein